MAKKRDPIKCTFPGCGNSTRRYKYCEECAKEAKKAVTKKNRDIKRDNSGVLEISHLTAWGHRQAFMGAYPDEIH